MNYRDECERIERERVAHMVWQSFFRPEIVRKLEFREAQLHVEKAPSEAELKESDEYSREKIKRLLDPKFHVISKMAILPNEMVFSQYVTILETANALSEDIKRNPSESFWAKFFGGRKRELAKLDAELEKAKKQAQGLIDEFVNWYGK